MLLGPPALYHSVGNLIILCSPQPPEVSSNTLYPEQLTIVISEIFSGCLHIVCSLAVSIKEVAAFVDSPSPQDSWP